MHESFLMHYVGTSIGKHVKCFILVRSYLEQKCCEIKSVKLLSVLSIYWLQCEYMSYSIVLLIKISVSYVLFSVCILFCFLFVLYFFFFFLLLFLFCFFSKTKNREFHFPLLGKVQRIFASAFYLCFTTYVEKHYSRFAENRTYGPGYSF